MFKNKRYLTAGIDASLPFPTQLLLWKMIDYMPEAKDYLQVFQLSKEIVDGKPVQKVHHKQEMPNYQEVAHLGIIPTHDIKNGKIFVIDDGDHSTMLWAHEY